MTTRRKIILKIVLTCALIFSALLGYLLWPIRTDKTIIQGDPALLPGKKSYLGETRTNSSEPRPNVVILFADDLGKYDISLYGGKDVPTPNIDALAHSGATFTNGYCTSPICSPSRAGLLTGRYQQRFGHELQPGDAYPYCRLQILLGNATLFRGQWKLEAPKAYPTGASAQSQGMRLSEITFADMARTQGYATAAIGKWHLGYGPGLKPNERGFDYFYGFLDGASLYSPLNDEDVIYHKHDNVVDLFARIAQRRGQKAIQRNGNVIEEKRYLTDKFAEESCAFIEKNKNTPFCLYVPFNAPHEPFQVPKSDYDQFSHVQDANKRAYYAMISSLDDAVGAIVKKVKDLGLEEKTLIFFISDNGGAAYTKATTNAPLKGGKLNQFEGGINVPFLMSWKGVIPANTVYDGLVSTLDVFTTMAANIPAPLPQDRPYDGVDLVQKVLNQEPAREALFWRSGTAKAVRKGDWKLVISERTDKTWLYNLADDISEETDLSTKNPEKLAELQAALKEWEKGMIAPLWPTNAYSEERFGDDLYIFDM